MATDAKTGQAIFGRYSAGLHNVGSYQSSGWPYLTGSEIANGQEQKHEFPMVTKSITVVASGAMDGDLRLHFASTASTVGYVIPNHHYFTFVNTGDALTTNVKCKEIYLSALGSNVGYEVIAELTNIPTGSMFALTGSGLTL
jgi:hypothetical protein